MLRGLKKQYYFYYDSNPYERLRMGLGWLYSTAHRFVDNPDLVFIAVNSMEEFLTIPRILREYDWLRWLDNPERLWPIERIWTQLVTPDRIPVDGQNRPLLVIHPTRKYLWTLDKFRNISQELVIPLDEESVTDWIRHHKAQWVT